MNQIYAYVIWSASTDCPRTASLTSVGLFASKDTRLLNFTAQSYFKSSLNIVFLIIAICKLGLYHSLLVKFLS